MEQKQPPQSTEEVNELARSKADISALTDFFSLLIDIDRHIGTSALGQDQITGKEVTSDEETTKDQDPRTSISGPPSGPEESLSTNFIRINQACAPS